MRVDKNAGLTEHVFLTLEGYAEYMAFQERVSDTVVHPQNLSMITEEYKEMPGKVLAVWVMMPSGGCIRHDFSQEKWEWYR